MAFDEAWLVVDGDQWTEDQLMQLHAWGKKEQEAWLRPEQSKL